jgi:hypothetical protein
MSFSITKYPSGFKVTYPVQIESNRMMYNVRTSESVELLTSEIVKRFGMLFPVNTRLNTDDIYETISKYNSIDSISIRHRINNLAYVFCDDDMTADLIIDTNP